MFCLEREKMKKLTIIGASGHGKVVADIAVLCGYESIEFLDDGCMSDICLDYPVVGKTELISFINNDVFVAIGNPVIRKKIMEEHTEKNFPILIHPNATVSNHVKLGDGTVIMAGAVVNPGTVIGKGVIINTGSSVDHDCNIENYVHIAVGSHVCGNVFIGESTWIGAGGIVKNNLSICSHCMIGAGAVVVSNIGKQGTYVGVPAKEIVR